MQRWSAEWLAEELKEFAVANVEMGEAASEVTVQGIAKEFKRMLSAAQNVGSGADGETVGVIVGESEGQPLVARMVKGPDRRESAVERIPATPLSDGDEKRLQDEMYREAATAGVPWPPESDSLPVVIRWSKSRDENLFMLNRTKETIGYTWRGERVALDADDLAKARLRVPLDNSPEVGSLWTDLDTLRKTAGEGTVLRCTNTGRAYRFLHGGEMEPAERGEGEAYYRKRLAPHERYVVEKWADRPLTHG